MERAGSRPFAATATAPALSCANAARHLLPFFTAGGRPDERLTNEPATDLDHTGARATSRRPGAARPRGARTQPPCPTAAEPGRRRHPRNLQLWFRVLPTWLGHEICPGRGP